MGLLVAAAVAAVGGPAFAADPPSDRPEDRAAAVLDRLRRRDPAAALRRHGGWRPADRPLTSPADPSRGDAAVPELIPLDLPPRPPSRLRGDTPPVSLFRRQQGDAARRPEDDRRQDVGGMAEQLGDGLGVDLEGLGLDDLNLPDDLRLDADDAGTDAGADAGADAADRPDRARRAEDDAPRRDVRDPGGIRSILPFDTAGAADGRTPDVTPLSAGRYAPRAVVPVTYRWAAPNSTYNPLYFQDVSLERYGHHHGVLQPAASVGKFAVQLVGLPYQMALDHPCKCETPLGYYRPGDCAPKLKYQIPLNARAALVQAAAVSGVALIIP